MVKMVYEEHMEWLLHISSLPLTYTERLKAINIVGVSRLAYRLAPILDLVGRPKYNIPKKPLLTLERGSKYNIFDRVEKAHRDCLLAVSGVSGFVVDKTLYTRQPQGYGLRHTGTVTTGMAALAYTKMMKKQPWLRENTIIEGVESVIFAVVRDNGGQVFGDPVQTVMEAHWKGTRPHHSANGVLDLGVMYAPIRAHHGHLS